ncbi:hypothetical protein ABHP49_004800 [Bacillus cereus]|uniref:hypothetical protein n=1 Tax=Bacillus cereus TaxID=1396 RepID=UPI000278F72C|nr:hypothetical protein [Bacillus cereus]EJQ07379.1 hypothetical protein IE1_03241 [Bacillus cereus BAG3O-2]EJQ27561.1 hypothetical protein IE7_02096 [Bacillus cereus BAG4O-1]PEW36466.1 hypothetical protein CN436_29170 [Bacillus cereus]HDR8366367.1 hypothetical protein [Bacillus cereus]HDR8372516.1 hypothetical protein [Bacillus cereus]
MGKKCLSRFGIIIIGASLALATGCTPQDKETAAQEQAQKEEQKVQKQAEKEAEKQRKQQEKEEKEEQKQAEKEQKSQEKAKNDEKNKEVKFKESIEKTVKKTIGKSDVESIEINKNFDLPEPNNKVVLLNLTNATDKILVWNDTTNILKELAKEKEIQKVIFVWKAELTDTYGNKKTDPVVKMNIDRETIDKINFDNFLYKNLPTVVSDYWQHPALAK